MDVRQRPKARKSVLAGPRARPIGRLRRRYVILIGHCLDEYFARTPQARDQEVEKVENLPTRGRESAEEIWSGDDHESAIRFMINVINATICSSGDDYESALEDFFPQLQALGHLIGAADVDEVSRYLRDRCYL